MNIENIAAKSGLIIVNEHTIKFNNSENIIVLLESFKRELLNAENYNLFNHDCEVNQKMSINQFLNWFNEWDEVFSINEVTK